MSIAFSRSLQSLEKDRSNSNLALVILFGVAILSWLYWFAFGSLTLYSNAQKFSVGEGGMISAQFNEIDLMRLKPGQRGAITFSRADKEGETSFDVEITKVPADKNGEIELYVFGDTDALEGQSAKISIAVGKIRPLELVWQLPKQ